MAEEADSGAASTPAPDETTTTTSSAAAETKEESSAAAPASAGEKRTADESAATPAAEPAAATKPKKAKIAMPPTVASNLMNTEKYKLESPPPEGNTNEADVVKKITTANLMLFGLHPLIKEAPLRKMLEDYGTVQAITVRSAFASRYGHVSFETTEEAQKCYVAIHGAKLFHKAFLVQPSMASAVSPSKDTPKAEEKPEPSAGAAASAAVAAAAEKSSEPAQAAATTTSA